MRGFFKTFKQRPLRFSALGAGCFLGSSFVLANEKLPDYFENRFGILAKSKEGEETKYLTFQEFLVLLAPEYLFEDAQELLNKPTKQIPKILVDSVDQDQNGLVDIGEFVFVSTLMAVPFSDVEVTFRLIDEDENGSLSENEFAQVMDIIKGKYKIQGKALKPGSFPRPFTRSGTVSLKAFVKWTTDIKREITKIEFELLDKNKDGQISASEFASSLVGFSSNPSSFNESIQKLKENDDKFSFDEFFKFQRVIEDISQIDDTMKLFLKNENVTKEELRRVVHSVCQMDLSEGQLNVLQAVFQSPSQDTLSRTRFVKAMRNRKNRNVNIEPNMGVVSCAKKCFNSEIISRSSKDYN